MHDYMKALYCTEKANARASAFLVSCTEQAVSCPIASFHFPRICWTTHGTHCIMNTALPEEEFPC